MAAEANAEADRRTTEANARRARETTEAEAAEAFSAATAAAAAACSSAEADARTTLAEDEAAADRASPEASGPAAPDDLPAAGVQGEAGVPEAPEVEPEPSYTPGPASFSQDGCSGATHVVPPDPEDDPDQFAHWGETGDVYDYLADAEDDSDGADLCGLPDAIAESPHAAPSDQGEVPSIRVAAEAEDTPKPTLVSTPQGADPGYQGIGLMGNAMKAALKAKFIRDTIDAPARSDAGRLMSKLESQSNKERLAALLWEVKHAWALRVPINHCHRWVQDLRDRLVALDKNCWDNKEYKVFWVDWNVNDPDWDDHGGLLIVFADGSKAYIDNGVIGDDSGDNDHVFFPEDLANHPEIISHEGYKGKDIGSERPRIGFKFKFRDTRAYKLWEWFRRITRVPDGMDTSLLP